MAPNSPEKGGQTPKEEREQTRQLMVDAWVKLDEEEKALSAEIVKLTAPEQADAKKQKEERIAQIQAQKQPIEAEFEKTFNCPIRRWIEDISKHAAHEEAEDLAKGVNTKRKTGELSSEVAAGQIENDTPGLAAQRLREAHLLPADLRGGDHQAEALRAVLPYVTPEQRVPLSEAAIAEIEVNFNAQVEVEAAANDLDKGVVTGRVKDTIKETLKDPKKIGMAACGVLGLWMFFSTLDSPSNESKTWVKRILGLLGIAGGVSLVVGGMRKDNTSLVDEAESALGVRMDDAFSSASMDKMRTIFQIHAEKETDDTDATDDFLRMADSPMENAAEVYMNALRNNSDELDLVRLEGNGLSSKEYKAASAGSSKTALDIFFGTVCYEYAAKKGQITSPSNDPKTRRLKGVEWALKNFRGHQLGTAFATMEIVGGDTTNSPRLVETIQDRNLSELLAKSNAPAGTLKASTTPGVYLIMGYPVRYNYTDTGDHVFKDANGGTVEFLTVEGEFTGDAIESTLKANLDRAAKAAREALHTKFPAYPESRFKYSPSSAVGLWELDPKEKRTVPQGLPNYKKDVPVEVVFYFDVNQQAVRVDMDADRNGTPDGHEPPFTTVVEVQEAFEKVIARQAISEHLAHELLGLPFTVLSVKNTAGSTTSTTIEIQYGDNHKGTIEYEADTVKTYKLDTDAILDKQWTDAAGVRVAKFLGRPDVQAELIKATPSLTGYDPSMLSGWMSKIGAYFGAGIQWLKDDSVMAKFHSDWEKQVIKKMRTLVYDPVDGWNKKYVDDMFKKFYKSDEFQPKEDLFFKARLTEIQTGVVGATVLPEKEPDYQITAQQAMDMVHEEGPEGGVGAIRIALSPLKNENPATMTSRFQALLQGAENMVTQDAVRSQWFDETVASYVTQIETRVNALPAPVTKDKVKAEIEAVAQQARFNAIGYYGTTDKAAVEKMMLAPMEGQPYSADWLKPTEMVASYVANNLKWENYGFLPNPENMAAIMKLWYKVANNAKTAPDATKTPELYARYFLNELWVYMGAAKDWSPEGLQKTDIYAISESNFRSGISGLKADLKLYPDWVAAGVPSTPPVPGMESSFDKYKEQMDQQFADWVKNNSHISYWDLAAEPTRWGPQMFKWSDISDAYTMRQYNDIKQFSTSPNDLYQKIEAYKKFAMINRYLVFEPLIMYGVEPEHWGMDIELDDGALHNFHTYFDTTPPNLPGYTKDVKTKMGAYLRDRVPVHIGVPFF